MLEETTKKRIRKFIFRWMVVNIVFLLIKTTIDHDAAGSSFFSANTVFYYVTAFLFFMITWEWNDWLIKRERKQGKLNLKSSLKIFLQTMAILVPVTALVYYLALFPLKDAIGIQCENSLVQFMSDFLRANLIGCTVTFFNLFYFSMKQKEEIEQQFNDLKREMTVSKYASLKSQISPHFLFNSLNTLTSLMYEDRDLASDFVTRLASTYRYILDNKEHDLVSLEKELGFLDSFIFMMDVRHKKAVKIELDVQVDREKYVIPTLSLQMLVENALKHNLYSKEKPLHITISSIENEAIVIKNNLQRRELKEPTTKMGLQNIKKRYAFYTNKPVLIREEADFFEVIMPLLGEKATKMNLKAIS
ncbi:histidine kinase [uncultured Croceitalea sp.]|uniref:sensor histidine kinase n=1 Tax=uncultured Croceitalea sp. TaxID=1798908 RepID=UPI003306877D